MNAFFSFLLGGVTVGLGMFFYKYKKNRSIIFPNPFKKDSSIEQVTGELDFNDVVAWLKNQVLQQEKDIPFIADASNSAFKNLLKLSNPINIPLDKKALFIGVYNIEKENITVGKLIIADAFDKQIITTLGNEVLVVLN